MRLALKLFALIIVFNTFNSCTVDELEEINSESKTTLKPLATGDDDAPTDNDRPDDNG